MTNPPIPEPITITSASSVCNITFLRQNLFPTIYGIGHEGLPNNATKSRKGQAKQLKGFLLFFEQIMANYLSQLSNIGDILSIDLNQNDSRTYHANPLYSIPDVKYLLNAFTSRYPEITDQNWEDFKNDVNNVKKDFRKTRACLLGIYSSMFF